MDLEAMSVGPSVCARQSENSTVQLSVQRLSRGQTPVRRTDACTLPRKWTVQRLSRVDCAEDRRVHLAEEVDCAAPEQRTDACTLPRKWTVQSCLCDRRRHFDEGQCGAGAEDRRKHGRQCWHASADRRVGCERTDTRCCAGDTRRTGRSWKLR